MLINHLKWVLVRLSTFLLDKGANDKNPIH